MENITLLPSEFEKIFGKLISKFEDQEISCRFLNLLKANNITYIWEVVILEDSSQIPGIATYGSLSKKELASILRDLQVDFGMKFTEEQLARLKATPKK